MLELPNISGLIVACDTETSGLHVDDGARVSAVSIAYRHNNELVVSVFPVDHGPLDKPNITPSLFDTDDNCSQEEWIQLIDWLSKQRLVFHKMYFDLQILNKGHRKWGHGKDLLMQTVWDTKLAAWVINPLESSALKDIGEKLWGEDAKAEQNELKPYLKKNGNRFDLVPWSVVGPYAARDAEMTLGLYEHQMQVVADRDDLLQHIELEIDVARTLTKMSYRGIGYNVAKSKMEGKRAQALMQLVDADLPFSPPTPTEARKYFYDVEGAIPHCVTAKTNKPSVSECCIRSLIQQGVPGADLYATRQKIMHAIGTYYEGYVNAAGEDDRIRTDWKQDGTVTMRFSSNRVNLQALPHEHQTERLEGIVPPRSLFQAMTNWELWEFDLAQAEARVAAKYAGCQAWLDMFDDGRDLHSETSIRLFGDAEFEHRQVAKRANFSLIYGVGPATFSRAVEKFTGIKLLDAEAKKIVNEWRQMYPEFPAVNKRAELVAQQRGYVLLADGRRRYFQPYEELHKAFNAVIQGSIAQFVKRWMVGVDDDERARVLLQIHDSLVVEIPVEHMDTTVRAIMEFGSVKATEFFGVPMYSEAKRWK